MKILAAVVLAIFISFNIFGQSSKSPVREVYISKVPKPIAPAMLDVKELSFYDQSGNANKMLDAGETAHIGFVLSNLGQGVAYNLVAELTAISGTNGLSFGKRQILGELKPGKSIVVNLPISASMLVESGTSEFQIQVKEGNGFDSDPVRISFMTQKFKNPVLAIADYKFTTNEGGKIKLGQLVSLEIVLQNKGQGEATDINIRFNNPEHVFPGNETDFVVDVLKPNESRKLVYEFFANKKYTSSDIPIQVQVTESYAKYGANSTLKVSLEQSLFQTQSVRINGERENEVRIDNISLTSDVDVSIPVNSKVHNNRFALIIGNEDYRKYQTGLQSDQNVMYARNDAGVFKEYAVKTLGVPENHAFLLMDATRGQMSRELERVIELAKRTPNAELIFYYAGHGLPDMQTYQGYLIPVDVTASNLGDAISLKDLYFKLASSKASKIYVFLDACFSGGGRGENGLLAARAVKVKPKGEIVQGNIVAFTATSGEEVSLPLRKEAHGLFTYHLLKKLKETQGKVTLGDLKMFLEMEIPKSSLLANSVVQTPNFLFSPELDEQWLQWQFQK